MTEQKLFGDELICPVCNHYPPSCCRKLGLTLRSLILKHNKEEIVDALIEYIEGKRIE